MDWTIKTLIESLANDGMASVKIAAFIRSLALVISANPFQNLEELNAQMKVLGWGGCKLDDYILQLVMIVLADTLNQAEPGKTLWFEKRPGSAKVIDLRDWKGFSRNWGKGPNRQSISQAMS
jgi:hypothetical protein